MPFLCFSSLEHTQESESWHENRAFVIPTSFFISFSQEANSCDDCCSAPINNFSYIVLFSIFIQQNDKPISINVLSFDKASWLPSVWYAKYIILIFKHSFYCSIASRRREVFIIDWAAGFTSIFYWKLFVHSGNRQLSHQGFTFQADIIVRLECSLQFFSETIKSSMIYSKSPRLHQTIGQI